MKIPEYKTYQDKQKAFGMRSCRRITTTAEFDAWYEQESKLDTCVFRGVKEAKYKNFTSSQRKYFITDRTDMTPQEFVALELESLTASYGGLLKKYCDLQGLPCSDLFLLSFAQHYGGISPLLDFTSQIDKALYFMMVDAEQNPAGCDRDSLDNYMSLYLFPKENILSIEEMIKTSSAVFEPFKSLPYDQLFNELTKSCLSIFSHAVFTHSWRSRFVLIENKQYVVKIGEQLFGVPLIISNLNIVAQDGCFVYSDKDDKPMEKGLGCLDIHKSLIPYIAQKYLIPKGITTQTMFPQEEEIVNAAIFNTFATPTKQ